MKKQKSKKRFSFWIIPSAIFLFAGMLGLTSALWYINVFGNVGADAIVYTLFSEVGNAAPALIYNYIFSAVLSAIVITAAIVLFLFANYKKKITVSVGEHKKFSLFPFPKWLAGVISLVMSGLLLFYSTTVVGLNKYIKHLISSPIPFIQDEYASPKNVKVTFPEEKQNLIIIYLESMETTFLSEEYHGGSSANLIPELARLAEENINFSNNETVGGFKALYGATWTVAAMMAMNSGLPLKLPLKYQNTDKDDDKANSYGADSFAPGATMLTDVLHKNGYYQSFMCGSNADFGNRRQLFTQHGVDRIYDISTAYDDGIVPDGYFVWWGMEDLYLFKYAKQELTKIAKQDKPFAFTMLTVDTHHVGGYRCRYCRYQYSEQYANVISCSSRQVNDFVNWIKKQDFYENTTIVITGDHPSMDNEYIKKNTTPNYDRRVYNCFINSRATTENTKNRLFSSLDMFPTILASLGCEIEGGRLGLGVNLFSNLPTLCEEYSYEELNDKLAAKSDFYDNVILQLSE